MCRMFAVRATHATAVAHELASAEHSLRCQSQCDLINRDHSDGWGVASFRNGSVDLHRGALPAYADEEFDRSCHSVKSTTVIAHVRRASKGETKLANSHPFTYGQWAFAHNGTLTALDALREGMLSEIPARLRDNIKGETDSELMFYWLLRRLEIDSAIEGNRCLSLNKMREVLATEILELDRRNLAAEAMRKSDEQAKLNVFLTNGSVFVGTRFRNTLFMLEHQAARPTGKPFQSIAIASEPPDSRPWQEIPDRRVFSISSSLQWAQQPMD